MRRARLAPGRAEETYRCAGCDARWSYEAVRYVALCPECASGLVRVADPERPSARELPPRR
jgi:Zn finger protein HypA/HybF involved in hydrogenase expression